MSVEQPPKALFFDVFGTVVEWRSSVTNALHKATQKALQDPTKEITNEARNIATGLTASDWEQFVEEWRRSYSKFTKSFDPSVEGFKSVDEHHHSSLQDLLQQRKIESLFTDDETWDLAFAWHRLNPWPDSAGGLEQLSRKFRTCTLSNGNVSLLEDLRRFGELPFTDVASAENFGAYKPSPKVYDGAAKRFGLEPSECGMVAAHLGDLKAAKACGFQTIYVERPREEAVLFEEPEKARQEGYVDMWIDGECNGLYEVAKRFGLLSS